MVTTRPADNGPVLTVHIVDLADRFFLVAGGLGVALVAYALSFRVHDKGRPSNPFGAVYYDLAPIEGRIGCWMSLVGLPLGVIIYLARHFL
jgi:hypothetical protein